MPQLAKGGKWVFGWSIVGENLDLTIPPDAFMEYQFQPGDRLAFLRSSKTSGGFMVGRETKVSSSIIRLRIFAQGVMGQKMIFKLPQEVDAPPGSRFLVVRGSNYALSFLKFGPIIEEASRHPEIEVVRP